MTNGVTATPCGTCAACIDIDAGRFVDLLELDAASNTGIDNMREILDNARYAPTRRPLQGLPDRRSAHAVEGGVQLDAEDARGAAGARASSCSATTDPQKIPVTVLSRCLQFNLKQLPPALIGERLDDDPRRGGASPPTRAALALIARAAQGSMRDALSLLDQAIAYGGGEVREAVVRDDAGRGRHRVRLPDRRRAARAATGRRCSPRSTRWPRAASPSPRRSRSSRRCSIGSRSRRPCRRGRARSTTASAVAAFAGAPRRPKRVQLAYQICVQGRADLALAPDEATGFAMTLLRLLAFEPAGGTRARAATRTRRAARRARRAPARPARGARAVDPRGASPAIAPTRRGAPSGSPLAARRAARDAARGRPTTLRRPMPRRGIAAADGPRGMAGVRRGAQAHRRWRRSSPRRPSSCAATGHVLTLALPAAHKHLADKAYADKLQGRARRGDRPQAAARLRGRVARAEASLAAHGAARARRAEGEDRGGVPRRAVRARRASRGSTRGSSPDSIKPVS